MSPGPIAPARELLGELLLETKQPAAALVEFEKAIAREPGRFRSIAGAMRAAEAARDFGKAKKYATELVALAKTAQPGRPEIVDAKRLMK